MLLTIVPLRLWHPDIRSEPLPRILLENLLDRRVGVTFTLLLVSPHEVGAPTVGINGGKVSALADVSEHFAAAFAVGFESDAGISIGVTVPGVDEHDVLGKSVSLDINK